MSNDDGANPIPQKDWNELFDGAKEFRCSKCPDFRLHRKGWLLARVKLGPGSMVEIMCPRCKTINRLISVDNPTQEER